MRRSIVLIALVVLIAGNVRSQRKLPAITFAENSADYANANRKYNDKDQYTDTLRDDRIVLALSQIMAKNREIHIEIGGHTAINEKSVLGEQRANRVFNELVALGVEGERMRTENFGHTRPIIADEAIFDLPTGIEKEAANQKNRRVEITVVEVLEK